MSSAVKVLENLYYSLSLDTPPVFTFRQEIITNWFFCSAGLMNKWYDTKNAYTSQNVSKEVAAENLLLILKNSVLNNNFYFEKQLIIINDFIKDNRRVIFDDQRQRQRIYSKPHKYLKVAMVNKLNFCNILSEFCKFTNKPAPRYKFYKDRLGRFNAIVFVNRMIFRSERDLAFWCFSDVQEYVSSKAFVEIFSKYNLETQMYFKKSILYLKISDLNEKNPNTLINFVKKRNLGTVDYQFSKTLQGYKCTCHISKLKFTSNISFDKNTAQIQAAKIALLALEEYDKEGSIFDIIKQKY